MGNDWSGTCQNGTNQSPINIDTGNLKADESKTLIEISPSDHTSYRTSNERASELSIYDYDTYIAFKSKNETFTFETWRVYFHAPAEHTINNKQYDLSIQIYSSNYQNGSRRRMFLSILWELDEGAEDDSFISSLNMESFVPGERSNVSNIDLKSLYIWAQDQQMFYYHGSETTPI